MIVYVLLCLSLCRTTRSQGFSWVHEFSCQPGQVYDTSGLTCVQCGDNEVLYSSFVTCMASCRLLRLPSRRKQTCLPRLSLLLCRFPTRPVNAQRGTGKCLAPLHTMGSTLVPVRLAAQAPPPQTGFDVLSVIAPLGHSSAQLLSKMVYACVPTTQTGWVSLRSGIAPGLCCRMATAHSCSSVWFAPPPRPMEQHHVGIVSIRRS